MSTCCLWGGGHGATEVEVVFPVQLDLLVDGVLGDGVEPQQHVGREDEHQARPQRKQQARSNTEANNTAAVEQL